MIENITTQYNAFASEFAKGTTIHNDISRAAYYAMLQFDMRGKRILDVGCGDGYDIEQLYDKGVNEIYGLDSSTELITLAKSRLTKKIPEENFKEGLMENLPYKNEYFDVVLSKYVLQTSYDVPLVLKEMDRVLRPGGVIAYLTVHPLRQFLEKKKHPKNYFLQEIVEPIFFGGTVSAKEPTHTMNEYLNPDFLKKYRITNFHEEGDFPSAENIDGDTYPCFFVLKAEKQIT
jgi:ubiquinone/menaquinone biosynthesis C-methylase UbiE